MKSICKKPLTVALCFQILISILHYCDRCGIWAWPMPNLTQRPLSIYRSDARPLAGAQMAQAGMSNLPGSRAYRMIITELNVILSLYCTICSFPWSKGLGT